MYRKPWEVELFQQKNNLALAIKLGHHLVNDIYGKKRKKNAGRVPLPTAPRKGETMKFEKSKPLGSDNGIRSVVPLFSSAKLVKYIG